MRGRGIDTPRLQSFYCQLSVIIHTISLGRRKRCWMKKIEKKCLHRPGIEPGPPAWQASILPLNQRCWVTLLPTKSICDGASLNVRDLLNVSKRVWMPRCGKEIWSQVPPRFELGSQDSESWVLTITPWNPTEIVQGKLRKSIWWPGAKNWVTIW